MAEATEADPEAVSRIGQGLVSCLQVPELQRFTRIRSICLHGNSISRVEGLNHLTQLQELNLSSNYLTRIENVQGLVNLTSLNLASNKLEAVSGLEGLSNLIHLNVSYNSLANITGLSAFQGPCCKLRMLNLKHNMLNSLQSFSALVGCMSLKDLSLAGNPLCQLPSYRQAILSVLPQITQLDNLSSMEAISSTYDLQAAQHMAAMQLQAYDAAQQNHGSHGWPAWYAHASARPQVDQGQGRYTAAAKHSPEHHGSPPPVPAKQLKQTTSTCTSMHLPASTGTTSGNRQPTSWHPPNSKQRSSDDSEPDTEPCSDRAQGCSKQELKKVYVADGSAQTTEYTPLVKKIQRESDALKQQLLQLTDELERRNAVQEGMQQQMQRAIQGAEDEAHRRVEEGYKEASLAVSKALQEVEAARRQAREAGDRAEHYAQSEQEAKLRMVALEKDLVRLQDDLRKVVDQSQQDIREAQKALADERSRWLDSDRAAQQQLHSLNTELMVAKSAAATAEQRIGSLEAALQQSSSVTVSMTSKIAQTMADATGQVDALKSKLGASEQQLAEQKRLEAEMRAEINMLSHTLTTAQQQHAKELESHKRQALEELKQAVEKERVAAEERGRNAALVLAQQDKSALQEQLTFLKVQLQYALKEGDKEAFSLQEHLQQSRQEVSELKAALLAASGKHKEHESLIADFSQVVQQQKSHIQALQKDKDALAAQLRSYGPEHFDKLAAENLSLRKAASQVDILQDQIDHYKRRWQEAETRLADTQASLSRQADEGNAKYAALDSSLAAARQELRQTTQRAEALGKQLASAEDAVRVKVAMLDSANETIAQLKAELEDLQAEYEDTRKALDEAEAGINKEQEQHVADTGNLRSELEISERALEEMSSSLAEAQAKAKDAESKVKGLQDSLSKKDDMLKFVQEEVDRIKDLFEHKEARLREERDMARHQAEAAANSKESVEARLGELTGRAELLASELETERNAGRTAKEQLTRSQLECTRLSQRVTEMEEEMQQLLVAVERQKAMSAAKMRQLASFLQEL